MIYEIFYCGSQSSIVNRHSSFVITNDKGQMTNDNPRAVFHESNEIAITA